MQRSAATPAVLCAALAAALASGCEPEDPGYALQARGGTYVDGTGRLGLALLATLRDGDGAGPDSSWSGTLSGPAGTVGGAVTYGGSAPEPWAAAWWPDEPGYEGTYALSLAPEGGDALTAGFSLEEGLGLAPVQPVLAVGADAISWEPVTGALSYECRIADGLGAELRQLVASPSCALSSLPDGAYTASVLAFSADLVAIAASDARRPSLPDRFDVSEARLALSRADGAPPAAALAVTGGAFSDGTSWPVRGLAVWVAIRNGDGTPTGSDWTVDLVGPGLPPDAPLRFTYPANFSQLMVWSAEVPATPGSYGIVARSADASVASPFALGAVPTLGAPTGVVATAGAQGRADVAWAGVEGAMSYLVSARHRATGAHVMSQWVAGTTAGFPPDTFLAGETYDVYVAATGADMVGGTQPAPFAITENSYQPASFVAR